MAVVGADHQAVFTRAADDVRHVVVYLAGDEDVVVFSASMTQLQPHQGARKIYEPLPAHALVRDLS